MTLLSNHRLSGLRALIFSSCIPANDGWETQAARNIDFAVLNASETDDLAEFWSSTRRMFRQAQSAFDSLTVR